MTDWLQPTVLIALIAALGGLLGGLGLLIHRVARSLPEVRATVDWWDARQARLTYVTTESRPMVLAPMEHDAPRRAAPARPRRRLAAREPSAQLTLDLDQTA